jgi:hypothetical protein
MYFSYSAVDRKRGRYHIVIGPEARSRSLWDRKFSPIRFQICMTSAFIDYTTDRHKKNNP